MSKASSSVFTVDGRVGLVEDGIMLPHHMLDDVRASPAAGPFV